MFEIIKRKFKIVNGSNHTKSVSLNNQKYIIQPT